MAIIYEYELACRAAVCSTVTFRDDREYSLINVSALPRPSPSITEQLSHQF